MEFRRRTLSSIIDNDCIDDDVNNSMADVRQRGLSTDEMIEEYSEYLYNGSYMCFSSICYKLLNLICFCRYNNTA
jgi:hypothetical protein